MFLPPLLLDIKEAQGKTPLSGAGLATKFGDLFNQILFLQKSSIKTVTSSAVTR